MNTVSDNSALRTILALLVCSCAAGQQQVHEHNAIRVGDPIPTADDDKPVYTGVRHEAMFQALDMEIMNQDIGRRGSDYGVRSLQPNPSVRLNRVSVAVHPSASIAAGRYRLQQAYISAPASYSGTDIGSEFTIWVSEGTRPGGTICVRERNVVLLSSWEGEVNSAKELLSEMVRLIREDRSISDVGEFDILPSIDDSEIAPRLNSVTNRRLIKPQLSGLGGPQELRCAIAGHRGGMGRSAPVDEAGEVEIPDALRDSDSLQLYIANDKNVFVVKEIAIRQSP